MPDITNENGVEICETEHVHPSVVASAKSKMPDDAMLYDLAELFKVFGDSTRMRILYALFESEMCVCDIANLLDTTVSAVSHQLRILRGTKLVKSRRSGKEVYYSLADEHVKLIIEIGFEHLNED